MSKQSQAANVPAITNQPHKIVQHSLSNDQKLSPAINGLSVNPAHLGQANTSTLQIAQRQDLASRMAEARGNRQLQHLIMLQRQNPYRTNERPEAQNTKAAKTYLILYGSGQVNPTTNAHNVAGMFQLAALTKLNEIKRRTEPDQTQHNIVLRYVPTEAEIKQVFSEQYPSPIAELHIFSHGWTGGINLGGTAPVGERPQKETYEQQEQRWLEASDFGEFNLKFTEDPKVIFYGCNIGSNYDKERNERIPLSFAQEFSNAFGVTVLASTQPTRFEGNNKIGGKKPTYQVPEGGRQNIKTFVPDATTIRKVISDYRNSIAMITTSLRHLSVLKAEKHKAKGEMDSFWNKAFGVDKKYQAQIQYLENTIKQLIDKLNQELESQNARIRRFVQYLPRDEQALILAEVQKMENSVRLYLVLE